MVRPHLMGHTKTKLIIVFVFDFMKMQLMRHTKPKIIVNKIVRTKLMHFFHHTDLVKILFLTVF